MDRAGWVTELADSLSLACKGSGQPPLIQTFQCCISSALKLLSWPPSSALAPMPTYPPFLCPHLGILPRPPSTPSSPKTLAASYIAHPIPSTSLSPHTLASSIAASSLPSVLLTAFPAALNAFEKMLVGGTTGAIVWSKRVYWRSCSSSLSKLALACEYRVWTHQRRCVLAQVQQFQSKPSRPACTLDVMEEPYHTSWCVRVFLLTLSRITRVGAYHTSWCVRVFLLTLRRCSMGYQTNFNNRVTSRGGGGSTEVCSRGQTIHE